MLHILGQTPESSSQNCEQHPIHLINRENLKDAWLELNRGLEKIDLVAVGSPHASIEEIRKISALFAGRRSHIQTQMKITAGRHTIQRAEAEGITKKLEDAGVQLMPDLCWCSIIEPIFPPEAKGLMTNSGKYAHYAHGLSNRHSRLGSLRDCVDAAISGFAAHELPAWLVP